MFERNKKLEKAINVLYEKLQNQDYGKRYTWNMLRTLAELDNKSSLNTVYYVVNKVNLLLMQNDQRYMVTEHAYGKRIIKPNEHSIVAKKKVKSSIKIYKKAGYILASTNMEELTDDQKKEIVEQANKYSTLEMFANEMLKKKKVGIPDKTTVREASLFLDAIKLFTEKKSNA